MIDKEKFFSKHNMLTKENLNKVIEVSIKEFPRKSETLIKHLENLNYNELMYFSNFIEDSFAFIYCDQELSMICRELLKAAKVRKQSELQELYAVYQKVSEQFLKDLQNLNNSEFNN